MTIYFTGLLFELEKQDLIQRMGYEIEESFRSGKERGFLLRGYKPIQASDTLVGDANELCIPRVPVAGLFHTHTYVNRSLPSRVDVEDGMMGCGWDFIIIGTKSVVRGIQTPTISLYVPRPPTYLTIRQKLESGAPLTEEESKILDLQDVDSSDKLLHRNMLILSRL